MQTLELTVEGVAEVIGVPTEAWKDACHAISLEVVKAGLVPGGRIGRGWATGVNGQHSWVFVGDDPYDPYALIVDPTLTVNWGKEPSIWQGTLRDKVHRPHGMGDIWQFGRPPYPVEEIIPLPTEGLSEWAIEFLDILGPLDRRGWHALLKGPMEGWPSKEVVTAASKVSTLATLIPIDILGMLTDANPGGLYRAS